MEKMRLSEIAKAVKGKAFGEAEIKNISIDSREIADDSLFTAIIGERFDGHDFLKDALQNGAKALLVSKKPENRDIPYVLVEDTEKAFADLSGYYRSLFSLITVGVTGSVGKTTTKDMIAAVLSKKYKTLKTEGNLNNQIGLPKTIFRLDRSYEAAVLELGMSNFSEISYLSKIAKPTTGVITLIGVSHLETLGSREGILKAKLEILDGMDDKAPLIVNKDNDLLENLKIGNRRILFFGINQKKADYLAQNIRQINNKTVFDVVFWNQIQNVTIPAVGMHNVYNALAAFAAGMENGMEKEEIAKGLNEYIPSGMRQRVVDKNGITVIEDCYNASPDSMKAALCALCSIDSAGLRYAVLGDMLELGGISTKAHFEVGELAAQSGADYILALGEESKGIYNGAKSKGFKNVFWFDNKEEIAEMLYRNVKKGDVLLFKASRGIKLEDSIKALYERWGFSE